MTETATATRLPLAELPATVLPGTVITLALVTDQLRRAVETARAAGDGRVLLRAGDDQLAVVAQVPDIGALPTGEPVAIVRVETRAPVTAVHASERGGDLRRRRGAARSPPDAARRRAGARAARRARAGRRAAPLAPAARAAALRASSRAPWPTAWCRGPTSPRSAAARCSPPSMSPTRVELVLAWARDHLAELQVAETIRNDVSEGVDKQQREFLLRQQLAAIRKELGEGDDDVVGEYRTKLETLDASESARNFIAKEIDRLERTSAQSPEHSWIRTWLDRVFELPWGVRSDDSLDLAAAQRSPRRGPLRPRRRQVAHRRVPRRAASCVTTADIDEDAERAATRRGARVDHHARRAARRRQDVSLGESIARAMGRQFVRVALGGIRDEAEIRGHRRTYVGSQPGRIVKAITEAGTMNPVVLLDEVDKLVRRRVVG